MEKRRFQNYLFFGPKILFLSSQLSRQAFAKSWWSEWMTQPSFYACQTICSASQFRLTCFSHFFLANQVILPRYFTSVWVNLSEISKVKAVMSKNFIADFISSNRGSRCLAVNDCKFNKTRRQRCCNSVGVSAEELWTEVFYSNRRYHRNVNLDDNRLVDLQTEPSSDLKWVQAHTRKMREFSK